MTSEPQTFLIYNRWWVALWCLVLALVEAAFATVILSQPLIDANGRIKVVGIAFPRWIGVAFVAYMILTWLIAVANLWTIRLAVDDSGVSLRSWRGTRTRIAWLSLSEVSLVTNRMLLAFCPRTLVFRPDAGRELQVPVAMRLYGRMTDFPSLRDALAERGVPIIERD